MEKENKQKFIKMIDKYIGVRDLEKIDEALVFLADEEHFFDHKFVKFVLSYTMIYDRDLSKWKYLKNKLYS